MAEENPTREEELPMVSLVTPTYGHRTLFELALFNFRHFDYPAEKLEWIIIDDDWESPVLELIPDDPRIRYIGLSEEDVKGVYGRFREMNRGKKLLAIHGNWFYKGRLPVAMKRNMGAKLAKGDIIVHMDDDDYYPPSSVRLRVEALLAGREEKKGAVGCTVLNNYVPAKYVSFKSRKRDGLPLEKQVSPASMAYWKSYWEKQQFDSQAVSGESWRFFKGRSGTISVVDPSGILVALHWGEGMREGGVTEANGWHFGDIPRGLFEFISTARLPSGSK